MDYQLCSIPMNQPDSITHNLKVNSVEDVRAWALDNVDTTHRWIIKRDGRNVAEGVNVERFTANSHGISSKFFSSTTLRAGYHPTREAAKEAYKLLREDYARHKPEADKRLDIIEAEFNELQARHGCDIDYFMEGDTHGIYEDYLYISITYEGHYYKRRIG